MSRESFADHPESESTWAISADTQQCAQEADASMAQDDWKYASPGITTTVSPVAESNYFLL
jgi:hypothetical protein